MEGMSPNFQSANAAMLQMSNYANIPTQPQQQQNSTPELTPQKKAVFERLKKRMNLYRKRQADIVPRFDQNFSNICEQQSIETNLLQKKFLESKAKRVAKKTDKKQIEGVSGTIVSKTQKRPAPDDLENDPDLHPPAKIPTTQQNSQSHDNNMKFQVEIVQQLEFTTNVANMQPQQISTNVTVKTTTNGSLTTKYEPQDMKQKMNEPAKMPTMAPLPPAPLPDILQDFKQEPDNEFADLDFGNMANFMANDENELKKLFSNISEVFDQSDLFDDTKHIKQEPMVKPQMPQMHQQLPQIPPMIQNNGNMQMVGNQFNQYVMQDNSQMQMKQQIMQQQQQTMQAQQQQPMRMYQQQQQPPQPQQQPLPDITPAAQTLKNMAQQHQVKSSMAMNYMRPQMQQQVPQQQPMMNNRMPTYQQQNYDNYSQFSQLKQSQQMNLPFTPDMIKQELLLPQQQPQQQMMSGMNMKPMMNHQMMHEEPKMHQNYQNFQTQQQQQFMAQQQQSRNFNQGQNMNIHMKQTQMMHIQQQSGMGGNVQMQGGQHMGMSMNDGTFSMQQQQNMYFNQHHTHQPNTHPNYGMQQAMQQQQQKRQQQHHPQGGPHVMGEGPTNTYNMMQSQSMSFTQ
ncbi:hypothetical protein PVAND_015827 [Polypedilum vanderplanki]|uniref:Neurogenic mastermind-like N-terminal domain-containing protein n=1 Tax=Polypedilum vanderplanki TaxID=319348 RepID=A0A9J6BDS0_POLVA|nr:hypothetical protein PVAND_015827 [Polypedilum vanderplanki]